MLVFVLLALPASALNGRIIDQRLDSQRGGYTILKVWGTPFEMGFAQGALLAGDIRNAVKSVKEMVGPDYEALRTQVAQTVWSPTFTYEEVEAELEGMVAGIASVDASNLPDVLDLKLVNIYGDWSYACRSHSAWGSFVSGTTKTISSRRLDFSSIGTVTSHHVLLARDPGPGGMRWVNLAFPGFVASITGVNEYGTLASVHDYQSWVTWGPHLPRSLLSRFALTLPVGRFPNRHLDAVFDALSSTSVMTGTFLNYYVPQGYGGVITCASGQPCSKKRVPQADFFGGQVLLTTNQETDGHTAPSDDDFMYRYYEAGGVKTVAQSHELMGHTGLHLLSLDFRGRGNMTVWFEGRLGVGGGTFAPVKTEWARLFDEQVVVDAGVSLDAGSRVDAGLPPPTDAGLPPLADAGASSFDAGAPRALVDAGARTPLINSGRDAGPGQTESVEPLPLTACSSTSGFSVLALLALIWVRSRG